MLAAERHTGLNAFRMVDASGPQVVLLARWRPAPAPRQPGVRIRRSNRAEGRPCRRSPPVSAFRDSPRAIHRWNELQQIFRNCGPGSVVLRRLLGDDAEAAFLEYAQRSDVLLRDIGMQLSRLDLRKKARQRLRGDAAAPMLASDSNRPATSRAGRSRRRYRRPLLDGGLSSSQRPDRPAATSSARWSSHAATKAGIPPSRENPGRIGARKSGCHLWHLAQLDSWRRATPISRTECHARLPLRQRLTAKTGSRARQRSLRRWTASFSARPDSRHGDPARTRGSSGTPVLIAEGDAAQVLRERQLERYRARYEQRRLVCSPPCAIPGRPCGCMSGRRP